jgi:hypothetical protein
MTPLEFVLQVAHPLREKGYAPTWAHILYYALTEAKTKSGYGAEPRLASLLDEMGKLVSKTRRDDPGLGEDQLREAAHALEDSETPAQAGAHTHERILRWRSLGSSVAHDWTVELWRDTLQRFGLTPEDFVSAGGWSTPTAPASASGPDNWQKALDELVGLASVKTAVRELNAFLAVQRRRQARPDHRGKPVRYSLHQVFTGNPGTGKTTVARIVAGIYREFGFLKKGHLVEVSRSRLVGGVIGETEAKTQRKISEALGGVLFVDEAYSLATVGGNDFGLRAIDELLKAMEDQRDEFVVIVAGYPDRMQEFLESNPGLSSRFAETIEFPDYSMDELERIFRDLLRGYGYEAPTSEVIARVQSRLESERLAKGPKTFGNGRAVRNLVDATLRRQALRIEAAPGDIRPADDVLLPEDVPAPIGEREPRKVDVETNGGLQS